MNVPSGARSREARILRTSYIGIAANVLLVIVKAAVGTLAGSLALVTDAVNNLSDVISSIITIAGTKMAGKLPDAEHPFGHGRLEYITALIIGAIVLAAGIGAAAESVEGILHPTPVEYSAGFVLIIIITIIAKVFLANYTINVGQAVHSGALKAAGIDARSDALISVVTLLSAAAYFLWELNIDAYAGGLISLAVIKAGLDILKETGSILLGERVDSELTKEIYDKVRSYPFVLGAHDLRLNNYGPDSYLGSIHVELDGSKSLSETYPLLFQIERDLLKEFNCIVTVGFYAIDFTSPNTKKVHDILACHAAAQEAIAGFHGICLYDSRKELFFDVTFHFGYDYRPILKTIRSEIAALFPDYTVVARPDINYADGEY